MPGPGPDRYAHAHAARVDAQQFAAAVPHEGHDHEQQEHHAHRMPMKRANLDVSFPDDAATVEVPFRFAERKDGLPGLRDTYGLRFNDVRTMQQALKYQSAGAHRIDCLDVYTTDGRLLVHDLVVLEDDGVSSSACSEILVRPKDAMPG